MRDFNGSSPQLVNNADSFAQAFDEAWAELAVHDNTGDRDIRLAMVMERIAEHPFRLSSPTLAEQVAQFRLRLLRL